MIRSAWKMVAFILFFGLRVFYIKLKINHYLFRKPDKTEIEEPLDACPYCSYPVPQTQLDCPECKQHLPYCIITVWISVNIIYTLFLKDTNKTVIILCHVIQMFSYSFEISLNNWFLLEWNNSGWRKKWKYKCYK